MSMPIAQPLSLQVLLALCGSPQSGQRLTGARRPACSPAAPLVPLVRHTHAQSEVAPAASCG